jgi:Bromodomain
MPSTMEARKSKYVHREDLLSELQQLRDELKLVKAKLGQCEATLSDVTGFLSTVNDEDDEKGDSISFTSIPEMFTAQRSVILGRVAAVTNSQIVDKRLPPLAPSGSGGDSLTTMNNNLRSDALSLTQYRAAALETVEAGRTVPDRLATAAGLANKESDKQKNALRSDLFTLVRKCEEQQFAWPFREPVDTREVPDYLDVISEPIDINPRGVH